MMITQEKAWWLWLGIFSLLIAIMLLPHTTTTKTPAGMGVFSQSSVGTLEAGFASRY